MKQILTLVMLTILVFTTSCTKSKNTEIQKKVYSKSYGDPNLLVGEITLTINEKWQKKVKSTDFLIWSLMDDSGQLLAGNAISGITFPYKIEIKTKQLLKTIHEGSSLLFSARLAPKGEEYLPPKKGQLTASYGIIDDGVSSKNTAQQIDEAKLKKIEQKLKIQEPKKFILGEKVSTELH